MKYLVRILVVLLLSVTASFGQAEESPESWLNSILGEERQSASEKARITKHHFGPLWTRLQDNASVLGFIGDDYQRLRIVILSATKAPGSSEMYNVTGKSMVKNVIRPFTGTIKITQARSTPKDELEDDYKSENITEAGVIAGEYHFAEDARQTNTGKFDGVFVTYWYVDKNGRLQYDEVLAGADGFLNNQFVGTWTSHRNKSKKRANWGDSRIPLSGDLDIGAGEFSPDEKYIPNGWQSYRDAYSRQNKRALTAERRQWWK